jgi:hypothetical protein
LAIKRREERGSKGTKRKWKVNCYGKFKTNILNGTKYL